MEAIQNYQTVEQQYRQRYKQRLERQYKIVKPDASPEEIRAVVEDDGGGQVFSQAVRIHDWLIPVCVGVARAYFADTPFPAFGRQSIRRV